MCPLTSLCLFSLSLREKRIIVELCSLIPSFSWLDRGQGRGAPTLAAQCYLCDYRFSSVSVSVHLVLEKSAGQKSQLLVALALPWWTVLLPWSQEWTHVEMWTGRRISPVPLPEIPTPARPRSPRIPAPVCPRSPRSPTGCPQLWLWLDLPAFWHQSSLEAC